ncbi:MAG: branched-subunit amino acid transport protein [Glaciecola sp.]|jgi:branched-subunit amino acid transport protein
MTGTVVLVVLFGGLATWMTRLSFVAFANKTTNLPPLAVTALKMIPPSALAALTVPSIARTGGDIDLLSARMIAGIVAAVVAYKTRNPVATMVVGIGLLAALQQI